MGNFPRYIPEGLLVEVTTRTIQGRLLLVPSRDLNDIVCGVLARALSRYRVAFYEFRVWYRQAADELKAGKKNVEFPPGCFPPGLPFCARPQPP